jgi:hypothetical protein
MATLALTADRAGPPSWLAAFLRFLLLPWKAILRWKIARVLAQAEADARPGDVPKMKVSGDPPVRLTERPTPSQLADFARWRSPTYVEPMSDQVADALALMILDRDRPEPFDAADMNRMMLASPSAYLARRDGDLWDIDFQRVHLYPTRAITIHAYRFHAETGAAEITDARGRVHRQGDPTFETALLHTMCWWSHYIHSGLHNWVHFHLPDVMTEAHNALSDKRSVLARLLGPHVRFTARINIGGLWENESTDNGPDLWKHLKPWGAGQSDAVDFRRGIIENTGSAYADLREHFRLPETFDTRIPYLAFVAPWFQPIDAFVQAVDPYIEDTAWEELCAGLEKGFPTIREIPRVRLLSIFLWQVGVLHVSDHMSYVRFAYKHAFHWVPEDIDEPFRLADVRRFDRFKGRNFYNVFVRYNHRPGLDHSLLDVQNYAFDEAPLAAAAAALREALLAVDADLERRGLSILRAHELLQSVCF